MLAIDLRPEEKELGILAGVLGKDHADNTQLHVAKVMADFAGACMQRVLRIRRPRGARIARRHGPRGRACSPSAAKVPASQAMPTLGRLSSCQDRIKNT